MFLKEIENRPPKGMMQLAFKKMREGGQAVPEIMHLFRFKKRNTDHLVRFTEEVMRGPSPLSRGLRELIGTFISTRNRCGFCKGAHAPVAVELLGQELVAEVLADFETSRLDLQHKELFRYLSKVADNPALVEPSDISRLKEIGWSEEGIYDALTVASLFKFYNTWNSSSGVQEMSTADSVRSGNRLLTMGYCMDFGWKAVLKVMWVGRAELRLGDCVEFVRIGGWKLWRGLGLITRTLRRKPVAARSGRHQENAAPAAMGEAPRLLDV